MTAFGEALSLLFLAAIRPGLIFTVVPFFAPVIQGSLPHRALVIASLVVVLPILWPTLEWPDEPVDYWALALKETFVASVFAFIAGTVVWAVEGAGELIDLQRGATIAGVLNPFFGATNSPTGGLFARLAVAIFHATGMYLVFFGAVFGSYAIYPLFEMLPRPSPGGMKFFLDQMALLFKLTILYAAPLLIVFLLVDVGLGFVNRFVPALNVFFLSLPIKSAVAFFLLAPYFGILMANYIETNPNGRVLLDFVQRVLG